MRYNSITVKRNFLIDPMTMEHLHVGVEVQLDEFDNVDECYLKARKRVEDYGAGLVNGNVEPEFIEKRLPVVKIEVPKTHEEVVENDALKTFWAEQMKKKLGQ